MSALQFALTRTAPGSDTEAQQAFRRVVLNRVARYRSGGLQALPEYHDFPEPARPAVIFSEILQQSPYLKQYLPAVAAELEGPPFSDTDRVESFLPWAKVIINKKAVVIVTHVRIFRPDAAPGVPTVLVAGKQVFASRYMNGELMLTMLFAGPAGASGYLVHVERSHLDTIGGLFGGLRRAVIETAIVTLPRPDPGPGEVLVRVGAAGVCHSDLHIFWSLDAAVSPGTRTPDAPHRGRAGSPAD